MCVLGGWWLNRAMRQKAAIEHLRSIVAEDGRLGIRYHNPDDEGNAGIPLWLIPLRFLAGDEAIADVLSVGLVSDKVTDDDLRCLRDIPAMEEFVLLRTQVTDQGLAHLKPCTKLRLLLLNDTKCVTDGGCELISELPNLEVLSLRHTEVTDAGMRHLEKLTKLTYLDLNGGTVTGVGRERLQMAIPNCSIRVRNQSP
jgi:hypothetical protein